MVIQNEVTNTECRRCVPNGIRTSFSDLFQGDELNVREMKKPVKIEFLKK